MSVKGNRTSRNQSQKFSYDDEDTLYNLNSEDEDNLYMLPDDDSEDNDDLPGTNYDLESESSDVAPKEDEKEEEDKEAEEDDIDTDSEEDIEEEEEDEDEDEDEDTKGENKGNIFLLMLKILSTPVEGCKELKRKGYSPEAVMNGCFLPMTVLAALSEFAAKLYGNYVTTGECMMKALGCFVSFFFGYFTVILVGGSLLPKGARHIMKRDAGKNFLMICFSTLCLFYAAINIFPMLDAVLVFLPIWTIYIIYKGVRFLRVPVENESRIKIVLSFLVIGVPFLWNWLLEFFFKI